LQEKITRRYLPRVQKKANPEKRARLHFNSPEGPFKSLEKIPAKEVLRHMFERTDGEFSERYGNVLSHLGMPSVQEILQTALTPNTRSLLTALEVEWALLD
jgi:hypothetical protein